MRTQGSHLVASAVEAALGRSGHTEGWLAERSGMERTALSARLRGEEEFTVVDVANIAAALGVSVGSLTPSGRPEVPDAR